MSSSVSTAPDVNEASAGQQAIGGRVIGLALQERPEVAERRWRTFTPEF